MASSASMAPSSPCPTRACGNAPSCCCRWPNYGAAGWRQRSCRQWRRSASNAWTLRPIGRNKRLEGARPDGCLALLRPASGSMGRLPCRPMFAGGESYVNHPRFSSVATPPMAAPVPGKAAGLRAISRALLQRVQEAEEHAAEPQARVRPGTAGERRVSAKLPRPAWQGGLAVLALILAWLAATAWMRPLMLPDEGRYAEVAWEMLRSGDWLTPTLDGLPFFHKPPLFYWITAAALSVAGLTEIAARAASLLGATLGAFSLYLFTRRWCGVASARRALAVLLVQPLFFAGAQFANLDMLVAGCITATVLALAHAALCFEQGTAHRRVLWLAYGLAALGVLAKGLIGFVIPAMVVGLWLVLRRRWRTVVALLSLPGLALFLALAAPWFVAMQQRFGGFLHYFFVVQHFQRFAAGGFNNAQPFWFYPVAVALCSLPAILWARGVFARGYFAAGGQRGTVRLLMALAVGCVLLFFSLPQSKLLGYILPAVPPLAWLIADVSARADESTARRRRWWATLACGALVGLALVIGLALDQRHSTRGLGLALRAQHQDGEPVY